MEIRNLNFRHLPREFRLPSRPGETFSKYKLKENCFRNVLRLVRYFIFSKITFL